MRGLVRVGAAVPSLALGNVKENMKRHLAMMREAKEKHVSIVTFPELSLTGYTCGDLFFQRRLLDDVTDALLALKDEMPEGILAVVGAPLEIEGALYNCAVVLHKGEIISAVPKTFLPNNGEFYEKRWFQSGDARRDASVAIPKLKTDVCRQAIFETEDGVRFGIELCEDLWAPLPPSTMLSVEGAEIILNLSASNELLSKREYRQQLISQQSARCQCGYVYVSAGMGESSSDLVFSGHSVIASCGTVIRESEGYLADNYLMTADIDIDRICADRMKQSSFADCAAQVRAMWKQAPNILRTMENALLPDDAAPDYHVSKHPFTRRTRRPGNCGARRFWRCRRRRWRDACPSRAGRSSLASPADWIRRLRCWRRARRWTCSICRARTSSASPCRASAQPTAPTTTRWI